MANIKVKNNTINKYTVEQAERKLLMYELDFLNKIIKFITDKQPNFELVYEECSYIVNGYKPRWRDAFYIYRNDNYINVTYSYKQLCKIIKD